MATYQETLDYLYSQLPMFTKLGAAAYKADLHNIEALCKALHNPQNKLTTIHVGGTNGKGSTSHMLSSILQSQGYKVGLYTSPHIFDFRERIRINGDMCSQQFVVNFVETHRALLETIQPSFFETTVAMAFAYFMEQQVDVAVIEVGLGGRLDSTNIITPIISIITNIGWDHMDLLGDTLAKIAREKAGIIKPAIPVVIGETQPETASVFIEAATNHHAPIVFADQQFLLTKQEIKTDRQLLVYEEKENTVVVKTDLLGIYQAKNVATVLAALPLIQKTLPIHENAITQGFAHVQAQTKLLGRWQVLQNEPTVIVEVAHNVNGIHEVCKQLDQIQYKTLRIVTGMVKDKDVTAVLNILPKHAEYYFTQAKIPRALAAELLHQKAAEIGLRGTCIPDAKTAFETAKNDASKEDLMIVLGSFFIIEEMIDQQ